MKKLQLKRGEMFVVRGSLIRVDRIGSCRVTLHIKEPIEEPKRKSVLRRTPVRRYERK